MKIGECMENRKNKKVFIYGLVLFCLLLGSFTIYKVVKADEAYNKIRIKTAKIVSIDTGTGAFDSEDGISDLSSVEGYIPGKDASQNNRIVRSFDSITYNFDFAIADKEGTEDYSERNVNIEVELTEEESKYVAFTADSNAGDRTHTYTFEGIDTYGNVEKSVTLYVLGAPNGMEINPKFVIKESTDEENGVFLGKVSSEENYYKYEDDSYTNQSSFRNYLPHVVSSKQADLKIETLTSNEGQKATYNGKVGRYITFVAGLYINSSLKGSNMPEGDLSFKVNLSQNGNSSLLYNNSWARLYGTSNVDDIESVKVDLPYSNNDSGNSQKEITSPGNLTINTIENGYNVLVKNYTINSSFPTVSALENAINNKFYIGTYAFTVFSPRVSDDGKNNITVTSVIDSFSGKSTSNENYTVESSTASVNNDYYQSTDHSFESGIYTEDDKKINSDTNIGSLSKGTSFVYKTTFNYKKTLSDEGIKEVIKLNPNAFRVIPYSNDDEIDIEVKCGDNKCINISKDDFEIKYVTGNYNKENYTKQTSFDNINSEDRDAYASACDSLDLNSYNSDQILNLYGGPCIKSNDNVETTYEKISEAKTSDNKEDKITKVIVQTKQGVVLPDNATVIIKTKLRVRNVPDITRTYQVASVVSTSDYDNVIRYYYPSSSDIVNPNNYEVPTISGATTVIFHSNVSYADAVRIASYTSDMNIKVLNVTSDGKEKINYNAVDNETIVYSVTPIITDNNMNVGADDTWYVNDIYVMVILPENLTYIADKDMDKYLLDSRAYYLSNGQTQLVYKIPFTKPNAKIDDIKFKAKLNPKLKGSKVKVTVETSLYATNVNGEKDLSLFGEINKKHSIYATGINNVVVEQMAGSAGTIVEKNAEFSYILNAYNNTDAEITNYEIINILPANGDDNGSKFSGTYKVKLKMPTSLASAKLYCSTQKYNELKNEINDSSNDWIDCSDITEKYKDISAIRISNISIAVDSKTDNIEVLIKPEGNNYSDTYNNSFIGGSETLMKNSSNQINVSIVSRTISGKVFYDNNENGIQDEGDTYVKEVPVTLLKYKDGEFEKVKETTTDSNGKYKFSDLDIGKYNILLNYDGSKYDLTLRYTSLDDKIDSDAYKVSDTEARISNKRTPNDPIGIRLTREDINLENYDMGLIPRQSFGFEMKKYITKIDLVYNGSTNTTNYNNETRVPISIKNSLKATAKVYYGISITNNSTNAGYVNEIEESIPDGLVFKQDYKENKDWVLVNGKVISTALSNTLIKPGETKYLKVALYMPTREEAGSFINTVSVINMTRYEPEELTSDNEYVNSHRYSVGEQVNYAGVSWHVIDASNIDNSSQKITLLADSGSIETKMGHSELNDTVYKWNTSLINNYINYFWNQSFDNSVLYDNRICDDASGLEVASYGGSMSGTCQSNEFVTSKVRLLTSEEYAKLTTSNLSNIDWLTGNADYWLQSSDDTRPIYRLFGTEPSDSYGDLQSSSYNKALYVSSEGIKTSYLNNKKEVRPVITLSSKNILFE